MADHSSVMLNQHRVSGLALFHQTPCDPEGLVETIGLVEAVLGSLADDVVCPSHVALLNSVDVDPEVVQRRLRIDTGDSLRVGDSLEDKIQLGRGLGKPDGWRFPST